MISVAKVLSRKIGDWHLSRSPFEEDFTEDCPVRTGRVEVEPEFGKGAQGERQGTLREAKLVKTAHQLELLLSRGRRHHLQLFSV